MSPAAIGGMAFSFDAKTVNLNEDRIVKGLTTMLKQFYGFYAEYMLHHNQPEPIHHVIRVHALILQPNLTKVHLI